MENIKIIIYSTIQGFTEFLPVSSSAHLYFFEYLFSWEQNTILFALGAHLGTFFAVIFHQREHIYNFKNVIIKPKLYLKDNIFILAIISSLPLVMCGLALVLTDNNFYKSNLNIIAFGCIIGGILLDFSDNYFKHQKKKGQVSLNNVFFIGFFQVLALIPGMSRSGTIITAMRFLNIERNLCIHFSLLSGIPVLFLACSYSIFQIFFNFEMYILKFSFIVIISFLTALVTIKYFISLTRKFSFRIFSIYRVLLGLVILLTIN